MHKPKCPECGSNQVWCVGKIMSKSYGLRQRYKCIPCATTFYSSREESKPKKWGKR